MSVRSLTAPQKHVPCEIKGVLVYVYECRSVYVHPTSCTLLLL